MPAGPYPEIDQRFGDWLAGFIDGEGCFSLVPTYRSIQTYQQRIQCTFRLALRDDDAAILDEIQRRTGLGHVRPQPARLGNPSVEWNITDKRGCSRLVEILNAHPLRAKKAHDFAIWSEAVRLVVRMHNANGGRPNDWSGVARLRQQLVEGRVYERPAPRPSKDAPPLTLWD